MWDSTVHVKWWLTFHMLNLKSEKHMYQYHVNLSHVKYLHPVKEHFTAGLFSPFLSDCLITTVDQTNNWTVLCTITLCIILNLCTAVFELIILLQHMTIYQPPDSIISRAIFIEFSFCKFHIISLNWAYTVCFYLVLVLIWLSVRAEPATFIHCTN